MRNVQPSFVFYSLVIFFDPFVQFLNCFNPFKIQVWNLRSKVSWDHCFVWRLYIKFVWNPNMISIQKWDLSCIWPDNTFVSCIDKFLAGDLPHGNPQLILSSGILLRSQVEDAQGRVKTEGREYKVFRLWSCGQVDIDGLGEICQGTCQAILISCSHIFLLATC